MRSFFDSPEVPEDVMTRAFSMSYKIRYLFEKLITVLNPEVVLIKKIKRRTGLKRGVTEMILTNYIAQCEFDDRIIENPFPDILLKITKRTIIIKGENFQYKFPPALLLEVWNRINKTL